MISIFEWIKHDLKRPNSQNAVVLYQSQHVGVAMVCEWIMYAGYKETVKFINHVVN
jgi:hypothetical protein